MKPTKEDYDQEDKDVESLDYIIDELFHYHFYDDVAELNIKHRIKDHLGELDIFHDPTDDFDGVKEKASHRILEVFKMLQEL